MVGTVGMVDDVEADALTSWSGVLGLASAMGTNVLERTREFAVMRAVGASRSAILSMVIIERLSRPQRCALDGSRGAGVSMKKAVRIVVLCLCCAAALILIAHTLNIGEIMRKLHGG